jgi:ATP-dependent Clp protease ATP-binding subunit ClpX
MNNVMYELPSRKDVRKCIITKDTVEKGEDPQLILEEQLPEEQPAQEGEHEEE